MAQPTAEVVATRRRLRRLRAGLSPAERASAEHAIFATLRRLRIFEHRRRVAVYLPLGGEVDLRPCISRAWRNGVRVFVPRIVSMRRGSMEFAPWTADTVRRRTGFGTTEPACSGGSTRALGLDTVLVPIVGFDRDGNRLGMGAGFYDRALRRRLDSGRPWRRPRLVGVAFACQELRAIEPSSWDVPLDLIVTERGIVTPVRRTPPGNHR
jgi:5-formyltetrahydrofolate cyclo-ligase